MDTLLHRRALAAIGVVCLLAFAPAVRADDVEQIEKATKIEGEADRWLALEAYDKANALLAQADKALQGIDETGKAEIVGKLKETRQRLADSQKRWTADDFKSLFERTLSGAEGSSQHSSGDVSAYEQPQAMLDDSWNKSHLDAALRTELQKKLDWSKKKVASETSRADARVLKDYMNQLFSQIERNEDNGGRNAQIDQDHFDTYVGKVEEKLASGDAKKLLTADEIAGYRKRLDKAKADQVASTSDADIAEAEKRIKEIGDTLDHPDKIHYWEDVEKSIGYAADRLAKCPLADPRSLKLKTALDEHRKKLASMHAQGDRDQIVGPALKYWTSCKTDYAKDSDGWEQESTPTTLNDFMHHSPPKLGCEKTELLLQQGIHRWLEADNVKKAQAQYANDPEWKKTWDEVNALREKATAKYVSFVKSIVDEAEKLPAGRERDDFKGHFYNLKNDVQRTVGDFPAGKELTKRLEAIEKKWEGDKSAAEGAKKDLDKKLVEAANLAWPGMLGAFKTKKLDAPAALANPGSWNGTYIHISGGARGVNLNRSGWDYEDQFYFIVDIDGIPVAGNLDSGLADAIKTVEKTTGIERDSDEEIVGVIDGTCKVWSLFHYSNGNKSVRDRQVDAVRMRIVALKAVTVAAACGQGTSLQKAAGYKDISVSESGSGADGSGRHGSVGGFSIIHFIHRFVAWGMCGLLVLAGLVSLAHGLARFVPQLEEQKEKVGDYLGYVGIGFAVVGVLWFGAAIVLPVIFEDVHFGSLPSIAMILAGAIVAVDLARAKGKLEEKTASMIQPIGIVLGVGCFPAAAAHFLFWNHMLL
jgi:hypothetical protein